MKLIIDVPDDRYKDVIESQKHHLYKCNEVLQIIDKYKR